MKTTTIKITLKTRERLLDHQKYGHTFDQTINRLLDILEMELALQTPPEEIPVEKTQT